MSYAPDNDTVNEDNGITAVPSNGSIRLLLNQLSLPLTVSDATAGILD